MEPNPFLGISLFMLGGLAGAVFYLPFKKVRLWAWESYWMIYAVAGLVIVPWALALSTSPNLLAVLRAAPARELAYCAACGAMWGVGGLTWGLMIRYLGVGLGLALGCGLCSAAGTLVPPLLRGQAGELYKDVPAQVALAGVVVSILGIILVGLAGMSKEKELPEEEKRKAVAEYNFKLGILVAVFSGLMSAGMNFGLHGSPATECRARYGLQSRVVEGKEDVVPADLKGATGLLYDKATKCWVVPAAAEGEPLTSDTWKGMPVLVVVLLGGFLVNGLWCLGLNLKNRTTGDYVKSTTPLVGNFLLAAAAGAIWCSQFVCQKTGEPRMGDQAYVGFAVLMASAILFSTILGILLGEWKGTSARTRWLLAFGLLQLVVSSILISGVSEYLKQAAAAS